MKTPAARLALTAIAAASLLLALPGRARAQAMAYNDPADFNAAAPGLTTYTFPSTGGANIIENGSYTEEPITFSGVEIHLDGDGDYEPTASEYLQEDGGLETLTLSGTQTAVSLTIGTFEGPDTVNVSVNGVFVTSVNSGGRQPATSFVGLTDSVPITSITLDDFTTPGNEIDVTGFQAVPEPGTWALLGVGVAVVATAVRRGRAVRVG